MFRLGAELRKAAVEPILPDEVRVRTAVRDPAVVHDEDLIGALDRGEAVGNGEDGLAARQRGERLLDEVLVFRVDAGRCLVQKDDGGVFQDRAGGGGGLFCEAGIYENCKYC